MNFLKSVVILSAGVFLAAMIVPGIGFGHNWNALFLVVLLLALFNAVLKPVLVFFALPFIFITLGIGLLFINALLLYWAARLVDGFVVTGFWSALGGAFVISFTNMMLSGITRRRTPRPPRNTPPPAPRGGNDGGEVIDV
jgi:putative membrane protein